MVAEPAICIVSLAKKLGIRTTDTLRGGELRVR
jgi:hypothetical protein